jgi:hypothetical protein
MNIQDLVHDVECGIKVLSQVMKAGWWDWKFGSALFFWRWNGPEQIRAARDEFEFMSLLPPQTSSQALPRLAHAQQVMVAAKLETMVSRSYLESGFVSNTLNFFAVPKGDNDIRVVFDWDLPGLNETLWAPNFFLPSARSASMSLSFRTWMSDMDFGEMFHNFQMDPRIRPFSGVELGPMASLMKGAHTPDESLSKSKPGS